MGQTQSCCCIIIKPIVTTPSYKSVPLNPYSLSFIALCQRRLSACKTHTATVNLNFCQKCNCEIEHQSFLEPL